MEDEARTRVLSPGLVVEYHDTEFYLVSERAGHDLTLALESDVAVRLAEFILSRRRRASP